LQERQETAATMPVADYTSDTDTVAHY
jgi:hypothetical protein